MVDSGQGSLAVRLNWDELRKAGASIKEVFLITGAKKLGANKEDCFCRNGEVLHKATNKSLQYSELIQEAASLPIPEEVVLKDPNEYTIIGSRLSDPNLIEITTGQPLFGIDQDIEGMVYASVLKCPYYKGKLQDFDDSEARKVGGVIDIIPLTNEDFGGYIIQDNSPNFVNGIAVIASNTWACFKAKNLIEASWESISSEITDKIFKSYRKALLKNGEITRSDGNIKKAFQLADKTHSADYEVPF